MLKINNRMIRKDFFDSELYIKVHANMKDISNRALNKGIPVKAPGQYFSGFQFQYNKYSL